MTVTAPPAARPAAPAPVRLAANRSRRMPWVALGVLLVVGGALAFALVVQSAAGRSLVVVAAVELSPGQQVAASDLRIVEVALDGPAAVVPAARRGELVGRTAVSRIPAGSLVSPGQFATGSGLAPGRVVVGAPLGPGGLPVADLRVGDRVGMVAVGEGGADAGLGVAEVFAVAPGTQPGTRFVSLAVADAQALAVTEAAAAQRLRLVLLPPDPEGGS